MVKTRYCLHPLLFAVYSVLSLYWVNIHEITLSVLVQPLMILFSVTGILWLLAGWILANKAKAALILSAFLVLNFAYGGVCQWIVERSKIPSSYVFGGWIALIFAVFYLIGKHRVDLAFLSRAFTAAGIFLVAWLLVEIACYEFNRACILGMDLYPPVHFQEQEMTPAEKEKQPDIYYFIFDRYANPEVLKKNFDFTDDAFLEYLNSRGFYLAAESRANYPKSFISLASSLNMTHLADLAEKLKNETSDRQLIHEMLQDYAAWRFLKARGYRFIHMGGWWHPTAKNDFADLNVRCGEGQLSTFSTVVFVRTLMYPILRSLTRGLIDAIFPNSRRSIQNLIPCQFRKLREISESPGPKFVFVHFSFPHVPYVFDADGKRLTYAEVSQRSSRDNYVNQVRFANKKIRELIEHILSHSKQPPVIVLQSDEGPCEAIPELGETCGEGMNWALLSPEVIRNHMMILNAYYLPGFPKGRLYPSVTPVNTFRLIFNHYFGADFEMLPDTTYIFRDEKRLYDFSLFDAFDAKEFSEQKGGGA